MQRVKFIVNMGGWMKCSSQLLAAHLQPSSTWSNQLVHRHQCSPVMHRCGSNSATSIGRVCGVANRCSSQLPTIGICVFVPQGRPLAHEVGLWSQFTCLLATPGAFRMVSLPLGTPQSGQNVTLGRKRGFTRRNGTGLSKDSANQVHMVNANLQSRPGIMAWAPRD